MEWLERLNRSLQYIEDHLDGAVDCKKAAQSACCSSYQYQRLFSALANLPLSEYIRKRRLTLAAFDLQRGAKVLNTALKYGYESPEAFCRAFAGMHGVPPSLARKHGCTIKAQPRLSFQIVIKGVEEMDYKIVEKPAFQVYGIERIFDTKDGENLLEIPKFWTELKNNGDDDRLKKSAGFPTGLLGLCGYRETGGTTFPYLICCVKTPLGNSEGYTVVDIPASTWAVFSTLPHPAEKTSHTIQDLSCRIYTEWLPSSNCQLSGGFDFELYYQDAMGCYYEEIWIRVKG